MLVSHNLHDIFEVADRITVLRLGQDVARFNTKDTTQREVVEAITAGKLSIVPGQEDAGARMSAVARAAAHAGRRRADRDDRRVRQALVRQRPRRRARQPADHRRPDRHRRRLPGPERQVPDGRQLRQPHGPGRRRSRSSRWASSSSCCSARSTSRSATSRASRGVICRAAAAARRQRRRDADRDPRRRSARASSIGTLHGVIITKVGIPSFVVTLAGLLAWNGVVLLLIGTRGTVVLQDDFVIGFANDFVAARARPGCSCCWPSGPTRAVQLWGLRKRAAAGPDERPAADRRAADRRAVRRAGVRRLGRQRGPRPAVRRRARRRAARVLDLRPAAHALRPPRLRRRRQRRGGAARGHQRRPHPDHRASRSAR